MPQGLLTVNASLDLDQFWPTGGSDADTTTVVVQTEPGAFRFRPHPTAEFQVTHAFDDAWVAGQHGRRQPINEAGKMSVRLEGIDAPELHYTPQAALPRADRTAEQHALYLEWNLKYRQNLAETATIELATLLQEAGQNPLPCLITTAVDEPDEVFDVYARFVGFLHVQIGGQDVDLNEWLVREGWTLPAFYSSMRDEEIQALSCAWQVGKQKNNRLGEFVSYDTRRFDFDLVFRSPSVVGSEPFDPADDRGAVLIPKLFRRVSQLRVNERAKMIDFPSFASYLRSKKEYCFATDDFLTNGITAATPIALADLINKRGQFTREPDGIVFQEAPSTLRGPGGAEVSW
jgi:endonuclease YncB( thermonuclease family)